MALVAPFADPARVVLSASSANIARHLSEMAVRQPNRSALKIPRGRTRAGDIDYLDLSFTKLHGEVNAWAGRLTSAGVRRGDRTLVMVRHGLPLIASVFALFKIGAVPVIIDPGMGLKSFLACVARSRPRALVGIPLAQLVSRVARRAFSNVRTRVVASASLTAQFADRSLLTQSRAPDIPACEVNRSELAAVLFTSGSTGAPKGVCYEHGMFESQIRLIGEAYGIQAGEIDLPMLPIFALFNPALGMTTVVPEMDPRRPAAVDPAKIVQAIQQESVTNSFGSPTLWRKIGEYCIDNRITLPTLRRVLCAGAPVPAALWTNSARWLPAGQLHSPYGATEALPVSSVSAGEIGGVKGTGACVGRPLAVNKVKIVAITESPIAALTDACELPAGEIGEIIVSGPTVTKEYDHAAEATRAAKIVEARPHAQAIDSDQSSIESDLVWHRMGDCGYLDEDGRLWFCGRKVERVQTPDGTLFTEPCEKVFRAHPNVARCALIGLGRPGHQEPALVVELVSALTAETEKMNFARELRHRGEASPATAAITRFYFHRKLPVDVRHNAKIHRLALARWAPSARPYDAQ